MIVCETERLRLRRVSTGDAPFILELLNDPEFLRNIGDRGVRTLDDARRYILTGPRASYERLGFGLNLVALKDAAVPIGICGLLRRDTHPDVELGFAFLPAFRRQGYAFEAAAAVLRFGSESLQLERIVALVAPHNHDSIRALQKLGFRFERMARLTEYPDESQLFALSYPAAPIPAAAAG